MCFSNDYLKILSDCMEFLNFDYDRFSPGLFVLF